MFFIGQNLKHVHIKRPTDSTTSGQTGTTSGQRSNTSGQRSNTSGQMNTTSGQTSTTCTLSGQGIATSNKTGSVIIITLC